MPTVCAAKTTVWDMQVPKLEHWNHKGFTSIELVPQGLMMTATDQQGQLAREGNIHHSVDTIDILYSSSVGAHGIFFWQPKSMEGNQAYHIPITFEPTSVSRSMRLDLSQIPEWDPSSKLIGFNLNPGSQLTLQHISLTGPGLLEKLTAGARSLLTFDVIHAYSVNFLWGPRMVSNVDHVHSVFQEVPPRGSSVNGALYVLLVAAVIFGAPNNRMKRVAVLFILFWILYDLRMGTEMMTYANTDIKTWWSKPIELKDYRDRGSFTAFSKVAAEFVEDTDKKYVLLTPTGWPYFNTMQYETYPASPTTSDEGASLWFVFDMHNAYVNDEGRILVDDKPVSPPGKVILSYEPGAFIFRTNE
ncbi:MAG: hypothetical protein KC680_01505 [Candidatus Peregrinibacteria bacterium]|nr:hypothetical protein [Candidatus Peregrinibacteria bacterium]MCB9807631.1 hypothetical protein [Candidatus Peribacteria bacterium]